jgi:hypothetical protein
MHAGKAAGLTLILAAALGAVLFGRGYVESAEPQLAVTAKRVLQAPDGPTDALWQQAPPVDIRVRGRDSFAGEDVTVVTRSVYTDDRLYFLFKWKDPTESVAKRAWKFDGRNWSHLEGDEDRIAVLFEIARINGFASKGCAVVCHSPPDLPSKEWKFATQTAAEKGDLWHWKAARSHPAGYADDGWLTIAGNPSGSYRTTGRRVDDGKGGDVYNQTEDRTRPYYMQDPTRPPSVKGFLIHDEAVPIPDAARFNPGDVITYRMPKRADGSRGDVKSVGRYADGGWTVMLSRKLDTGHADDVAFNPRRDYSFAIAVFDNTGEEHSKGIQAMLLKFQR